MTIPFKRLSFLIYFTCICALAAFGQRPNFDALRGVGGGITSGIGGASRTGGSLGTNSPRSNGPAKVKNKKKLVLDGGPSVVADSLWSKTAGFENVVEYYAADSSIMAVEEKALYLYGDAEITYGDISLSAAYIKIDWGKDIILAHGTTDTAKKEVGKPIFSDKGTAYNTDTVRYNIKSKRALIKGIVTQQGDGFLQGAKVKKDSLDNLYLIGSKYTTCNLKHPHFHLGAKNMKLVGKKQVISGPLRLYVEDIPLPLIIPFGWFPVPENKEIGTSGFIMPTYGEEPNGRGFYLRDGGYFFAISDKFNFKVLGQVYSRGSWGMGAQSTYSTKYKYNGNLNIQFNNNRIEDADFLPEGYKRANRDASITWSHSPVNLRPDRSFSTNVNFVTNGFNQNNARDVNAYTQNTFGSGMSYSRTFNENIRTSLSYRIDQNVRTKVMNTGLDLSLNLNQFNPFIPEKRFTGRKVEQLRLGFDFSGGVSTTNNITGSTYITQDLGYKIKGTTRVNPDSLEAAIRNNREDLVTKVISLNSAENIRKVLDNGQFRGNFSLPISLPNFKIAKYINLTPGMSMNGTVLTRQFSYQFDPSDNTVVIDTTKGVFFVPNYAFSASMNTRAYGTFHFKNAKRLASIRHTLAPSIGWSMVPNLTTKSYYFQNTQINPESFRYLARFDNLQQGTQSGGLSFSLLNSVEGKVRSKADSSESDFEKISLLDNLSLSSGYNFFAPGDTNKLSQISLSANTVVLKKYNVSFSSGFDPYLYVADKYNATNYTGIRTKKYLLAAGQGLARLNAMNLGLTTSFKPKTKTVQNPNVAPEQKKFIEQNADLYVDFNIPWSLNLNYSFNYYRPGLLKPQIENSLNFNGDFSLTPKWKFGLQSGWDFKYQELTLTTINFMRELHCWDMSFNWTPKAQPGSFRVNNYEFTLRARGNIMNELKLSRRRSFYDRGGF